MTEAQKLNQEMNEMIAKFRKNKEANTVSCDMPKSKRGYTYRTQTIIKAQDLAL